MMSPNAESDAPYCCSSCRTTGWRCPVPCGQRCCVPMSTHDRLAAFLDDHQRQHRQAGTLCVNLCLAAALTADDGMEPCAEFGSHPRGKHAEVATRTSVTPSGEKDRS
jgi:hypothetical protein